jgi:hypothetical protein
VHIPGLLLLNNIISTQQEELLLAILQGPHAPWAPAQPTASSSADKDATVKRAVQHYGYGFDYQTNDILRSRYSKSAHCPAMPALPQNNISTATNTTTSKIDNAPAEVSVATFATETSSTTSDSDVDEPTKWSSADLESYMQKCVQEGRGWESLAGMIERVRQYQFQVGHNKATMPVNCNNRGDMEFSKISVCNSCTSVTTRKLGVYGEILPNAMACISRANSSSNSVPPTLVDETSVNVPSASIAQAATPSSGSDSATLQMAAGTSVATSSSKRKRKLRHIQQSALYHATLSLPLSAIILTLTGKPKLSIEMDFTIEKIYCRR